MFLLFICSPPLLLLKFCSWKIARVDLLLIQDNVLPALQDNILPACVFGVLGFAN